MVCPSLAQLANKIRSDVIEISYAEQLGHVGSNLSVIEALVFIAAKVNPKQDFFLLSKGHAALSYYLVLREQGLLDLPAAKSNRGFVMDGLGYHPPLTGLNPLVPFGSGSLGHGLGLASGLALGKKLQKQSGHTYVVLSDGELNEGSTWESLMFAAHHNLNNLTMVIDANGFQGFGQCSEVIALAELQKKLTIFGWQVIELSDGNDLAQWQKCWPQQAQTMPLAVISKSVKGKGIARLSGRLESHYERLKDSDRILPEQIGAP